MGQYGYAFDKLINQEYTTEVFLSDLNNSYLAAENAIDSMCFVSTIVNEEETGLSASDDIEQDSNVEETKLKLKDKLKEMLAKFLKWFKSIWDKLADTVKKAIEVIKDNTIQDKIMAKLFDDLSYSDVEKAIEAGWKGLNYKATACPDPVTMNDSTIKKRISKMVQKPHDLAGQIDKILYVNSADEAKEIYEDVSSQCKKFLTRYETQKNDPSEQMRYGEIERITRRRAFSFLDDDKGSFGSVFFTYLSIKNPNAEGYGFPSKQQFDDIKLMAIGGQRYCVILRKEYYNNHIKDLELFIDKDIENIFKNFSDPSLSKESNQIMRYYYKSMLASDRTQLVLHNRICSEVVQMIHFQTKIGIRTYLKLLSAVKLFVMGKASMA